MKLKLYTNIAQTGDENQFLVDVVTDTYIT